MSPPELSETDRQAIELLRLHSSMSVEQLVEGLGVTATAVRQRLTRLLAGGLIERTSTAQGRGRPRHDYRLTKAGQRTGGNNLEDLAKSLWEEVQMIGDDRLKQQVIAGVVRRLAEKYAAEAGAASVEERMRRVIEIFTQRRIPVEYSTSANGLPIVKVSGCPYPDLADDNRDICEMEKALLARVLGTDVQLCQCQQDGDRCCSFEAVPLRESTTGGTLAVVPETENVPS